MIQKFGKTLGLSASLDAHSLGRHASEALLSLAAVRRAGAAEGPWLDVGSGGGFPGLIVAAATGCPLVLVEPRARQAAFLEFALSSLGRRSAEVRRARLVDGKCVVLDGGAELPRGFAVADARAVFPPAIWLRESRSWLRTGGLTLVHLPIAGEIVGEVPRASAIWGDFQVSAYGPGSTVEGST